MSRIILNTCLCFPVISLCWLMYMNASEMRGCVLHVAVVLLLLLTGEKKKPTQHICVYMPLIVWILFVVHINVFAASNYAVTQLHSSPSSTAFPSPMLLVRMMWIRWKPGGIKSSQGFHRSVGGLTVSSEPWSDGVGPPRDSASGTRQHRQPHHVWTLVLFN